MKLLCPKCSSECEVTGLAQDTLKCPSCGLALFISTSVRGRISSTRVGQLSDWPAVGHRAVQSAAIADHESLSQQTVSFVGEALTKAPELTLIPQFLGRYEVVDFLGSGAFSRVYLAKDPELGRLVALKVPRAEKFESPEDLATFFREARTIAGLDHPGIVAVYDIGSDGSGTQFIVMQYIQGMTLQQRISVGPMSYPDAAEFIYRVAEAIHVAHKKQVFHRDLKPANILIDTDGRPHVADFGLAILEHQQQQHAGEVAGTLLYMAPEQLRGEAQWLDGRSDIWSLGAIFYSLLTGRHPFLGNGQKISDEILHREPRPPRQINERIPKELERICLKCLTKPVRERYFSAFDVAEDLKAWLQTESDPVSANASSYRKNDGRDSITDPIRQSSPTDRRKGITFALTGAAALALAAIAGSKSWGTKSNPDQPIIPGVPGNGAKSPANSIAEAIRTPSPFKLDSYAVVGVWNELLATKPRVFFVAPYESARWPHDPEQKELLLDVPAPAYLELGTTESTHFTLETRISSTNWSGQVGLYWGCKDFPRSDLPEVITPHCHVIYLRLYRDESGKPAARIARDLAGFSRRKNGTITFNTSEGVSAQGVPLPGHRPVQLELRIVDKSLQVFWNTEQLTKIEQFAFSDHFKKVSARGGFGIIASGGVFKISDARIRLDRDVPRTK